MSSINADSPRIGVSPALIAPASSSFPNKISTLYQQSLHPLKEFNTACGGLSLGLMPLHLIELASNCKSLIVDSAKKKINAFLGILSTLKEVGEGITAFAGYLVGLQVIAESAVAWSGPLGLAMSVLSIASIASKAKICKETRDLVREFEQVEQANNQEGTPTLATYREIVRWIENKRNEDGEFLADVFNVKARAFADALEARENSIEQKLSSADASEKAEGQRLLVETIKSLKGRVQKNITSSVLSIVASVVNMIGAIVIFCCPVLPVGWALVGLAALIDGSKLVHHKITEYQFAQQIGMQRTRFEWVTC